MKKSNHLKRKNNWNINFVKEKNGLNSIEEKMMKYKKYIHKKAHSVSKKRRL